MKRILITGASGFLGRHLVQQLETSEQDTSLRLFSRAARTLETDAAVQIIPGDVTQAAEVLRAAEGVNEIYHLAGIVCRNPRDPGLLYRTHIGGTRNVCEAALRWGVGKVVVVSSSGTLAVSPQPALHDENSGYKNDVVGEWPYYLSKIYAEKLALDFARRCNAPVVVVNPSLILGPGDDHQSSTGDVASFLQGQILAIPPGGLNFVDVRDVACGLLAAMKKGKPGERYLLGGVNWTLGELIEAVALISGRKAPKLRASPQLSLLSARWLRRLLPLIGKPFRLDDASIKMSALFWYCDSGKARRELGFETREAMETLRDTVAYLRRLPLH